MKRITVLYLILSLYPNAFADKKMNGKLILGRKSVEIMVKVPRWTWQTPYYVALQTDINVIMDDGKRKKIYPNQGTEVHFNYHGIQVEMVSVKNDLKIGNEPNSPYIFLEKTRICPDKLGTETFYNFYYRKDMNGSKNMLSKGIRVNEEGVIFYDHYGLQDCERDPVLPESKREKTRRILGFVAGGAVVVGAIVWALVFGLG